MKYDVAAVFDTGDMYRVKFVDSNLDAILKNDENYVKISNVAGDMMRQAISERKLVFLPKNVSGELGFNDVVIVDVDGIEKDKMILLSDIYRRMDWQTYSVSAISFFDYMNSFSELASNGYFITDRNREEKYLEIIETGDENLISTLEVYLENMDKVGQTASVYNKIKRFETEIYDCETPEEFQEIRQMVKDELKI